MVVVHHATHSVPGAHWMPFGGAGVDIFFVISGYVMAHTTQNLPSGQDSASRFIRKRIARIVPLYWLAILWVTRRTPPDLNLLRDFFFIPHYNAQYPTLINPILVQGWTLNYEMLFYAHNHAFALWGGVPRRGIYDNMSTAVDRVGPGKQR